MHNATTSVLDVIGIQPNLKVEPLAAEVATEQAISCSYRISMPSASIRLHPGKLYFQIMWRTGHIICTGVSCASNLAFPCQVVKSGWAVRQNLTQNVTHFSRIACCIWPYEDEVARCMVLVTHFNGEGRNTKKDTVFVRRRECLPCCTKSILQESSQILADEAFDGKVIVHIV